MALRLGRKRIRVVQVGSFLGKFELTMHERDGTHIYFGPRARLRLREPGEDINRSHQNALSPHHPLSDSRLHLSQAFSQRLILPLQLLLSVAAPLSMPQGSDTPIKFRGKMRCSTPVKGESTLALPVIKRREIVLHSTTFSGVADALPVYESHTGKNKHS